MSNMIEVKSAFAAVSGTAAFNYNIVFYIFLIIGIILFIGAVIMFFALDIPSVYLIISGKGAKKTVKKMEQINAETGRLRKESDHPIINLPTPDNITDEIMGTAAEATNQKKTKNTKNEKASESSTITMQQASETTLLSAELKMQSGNLNNTNYVRKTSGKFDLVYNNVMIHANEII